MKRNTIYAYLAGIFVTMVLGLVAVRIWFPYDVALVLIPMYVVMITLWLYAYRVSRKKQLLNL